jgi:Ser/Thr protein kinase RdoA (MazF antagonist)
VLPIEGLPSLGHSWDAFERLLRERRAACGAQYAREGAMPRWLVDEIDAYVLPLASLVDRRRWPHLVHGDLNEDHVLGVFEGEHWRPTGIIDFGDARAGDRLYDLVALHVGLFHCDKRLLRIFLAGYGTGGEWLARFVARAMSLTLLHEFTVLGQVFAEYPAAREVASMADLAALLWDLQQPGLTDPA